MKNKWDTHVEPYLLEVEAWAMKGAAEKEIADRLNISYATFRKYVKTKPELASILAKAKRHVDKVVRKALEAEKLHKREYAVRSKEPATIYVKPGGVARPDQNGTHRGAFEKNKKRIYATQDTCGICGKPVDFSLKHPHPLSPCIDHIIPIAKGGHPSDITNLQLAHRCCNRQKSDKLVGYEEIKKSVEVISNRILPQSMDWAAYRANGK